MKKIVVAIDGLRYSESATKYAVYMAKQANAHLVAVFLDDFTRHSYAIYDLIDDAREQAGEKRKRLEEDDKKMREQSVAYLEEACQEAALDYSIHHDKDIAIKELLHESVYADLLVIDSQETLSHYEEKIPTGFIRDFLSEVQCPVLVVPKVHIPIDKIELLYDGEPSSVFAIRTFSYIFPSLKYLPVEVLAVKNDDKPNLHLPDNWLMKEFMKRHYPTAEYVVLKGYPETEIVKHLAEKGKNTLIVLGAYRRSMVSRWFRPSMADVLMEELKNPLFIAHNK